METKTTDKDRSSMMRSAWALFRKLDVTFSEAMKMAWKSVKLRIRMRMGVVRFKFRKVDGTIRNALGTLMEGYFEVNGSGKPNYSVQTYFDVEKGHFRSFQINNLI